LGARDRVGGAGEDERDRHVAGGLVLRRLERAARVGVDEDDAVDSGRGIDLEHVVVAR
jgi:hypothetical protein